jgi:hypothetical protein
MKKEQKLKLIGYFVLIILIINLIVFGMGLINWMVFWGIIALGALFVYKGLPKLKEIIK